MAVVDTMVERDLSHLDPKEARREAAAVVSTNLGKRVKIKFRSNSIAEDAARACLGIKGHGRLSFSGK